jgi:hypothetical protein
MLDVIFSLGQVASALVLYGAVLVLMPAEKAARRDLPHDEMLMHFTNA